MCYLSKNMKNILSGSGSKIDLNIYCKIIGMRHINLKHVLVLFYAQSKQSIVRTFFFRNSIHSRGAIPCCCFYVSTFEKCQITIKNI